MDYVQYIEEVSPKTLLNKGGNTQYILDESKFEKAKYEVKIVSDMSGIITDINAEEIGILARDLGGGRIRKDDKIDYAAGVKLSKKIGQRVCIGEEIAIIFTNKKEVIEYTVNRLKSIFKIETVESSSFKRTNVIKVIS